MKKLIALFIIVFAISAAAFSQSKINNGLYLVDYVDTVKVSEILLNDKEMIVYFSPMFDEFNSDKDTRIIIDTTQYVPLELETPPVTEQQTENKKKLLLSLTKEASERLESFTTKNIMRMVTLVVDGEALTLHKIKAVINGGQLQITRCNDNACETLYVKLKENIKK